MITIRIADLTVGVFCEVETLAPSLEAMLAPYPKVDATPDLVLGLAAHPQGAAIVLDREQDWAGDARAALAGLEVKLYLRVLAALSPRFVSLHAGWVAWQGKGIVFAGESGAGKSSLVAAALLAGAHYGSDEFTLLGEDGCLAPFPRPLQWGRVRHPAFTPRQMYRTGFRKARLLFPGFDGRRRLIVWWLPPRVVRDPMPVGLLCLVRYRQGADVELRELPRAAALMRLAAQMHTRLPMRARIQALHRRLPRTLRCVELAFADARMAWAAAAEAARQAADGRKSGCGGYAPPHT